MQPQTKIKRITILIVTILTCSCSARSIPGSEVNHGQGTMTITVERRTEQGSTSTPFRTSDAISSLSATPMLTAAPSPSPTLAPTPVFGTAQVGEDFLFEGQPSGCELPCWQNLNPGETRAHEVQKMLDMAFGFSGTYDFIEHAKPDKEIEGLRWTGFTWDIVPGSIDTFSPEFFNINVWIDENSQMLEAIQLLAVSQRFGETTSPQYVIKKLGMPSRGLASVQRTAVMDLGSGAFMLHYDQGVTILYTGILFSIDPKLIDDPNDDIAEVCLGTLHSKSGIYWVDVYLTQPFQNGFDELTPIQEYLMNSRMTVTNPPFDEFEEVFDLSLEDITRLAQQKENACLQIVDLPPY